MASSFIWSVPILLIRGGSGSNPPKVVAEGMDCVGIYKVNVRAIHGYKIKYDI